MLQTNPDNVERVWPTLGMGVGPGETIDHPVLLPGMLPVAPVETEGGCRHAECVLEHPHAGPAILTEEGAAAVDAPTAKKSPRAARRSL